MHALQEKNTHVNTKPIHFFCEIKNLKMFQLTVIYECSFFILLLIYFIICIIIHLKLFENCFVTFLSKNKS